MQRALIAGILLALLLAVIGIFVILKKMAFFGDGIAHASLAGIAIALLAGTNPLLVAIIYSVLIAIVIYFIERKTNLSSDTIIGIFFTASMSFGVILMSYQDGYQPELVSFLFGNILAIKSIELFYIAGFTILLLAYYLIFFRKIALVTFDREMAYISGVNATAIELVMYVSLAIAVVLGVKILGIVLVSALLIIPPSIAKTTSQSFKSLIFTSIVISEVITILGIFLSYHFNWPTGATIVLTGTMFFILSILLTKIIKVNK
jgi:ABC-type Mn2+/Zn2+ transport system permease subunit